MRIFSRGVQVVVEGFDCGRFEVAVWTARTGVPCFVSMELHLGKCTYWSDESRDGRLMMERW